MNRAGFVCEQCDDDGSTLNVHHSYYESGLDPWEYPDESLHCLCENCHEEFDELRRNVNRQIGRLRLFQIQELLGFVRALELELGEGRDTQVADNHMVLSGMMRVFCTLDGRVIDRCVDRAVSLIGDGNLVDAGLLISAAQAMSSSDRIPHRGF